MKAPDKIYLEKSLSFPDKFHSQWYKEDIVGNGVEYIRKNLLLEWAKEKVALYERKMQEFEQGSEYEVDAYRQIVDKLNSL